VPRQHGVLSTLCHPQPSRGAVNPLTVPALCLSPNFSVRREPNPMWGQNCVMIGFGLVPTVVAGGFERLQSRRTELHRVEILMSPSSRELGSSLGILNTSERGSWSVWSQCFSGCGGRANIMITMSCAVLARQIVAMFSPSRLQLRLPEGEFPTLFGAFPSLPNTSLPSREICLRFAV
jgi:hypothetical protein